ncbi:ABC-type multidrug transport system ATPase subunit [Streptosporangium album]|uniref:ABC-type multidrug transport system ATPase subunit n=1 Tax=Streptosporangium album TaxID=47479 RepID=A0A7W7WE74_9ACTN|nr:ABC-type multidrug transport system ATPase subunit [Streptosporangium album]
MNTPVRRLSLGQRMRGEITAALLHSPAVLVLDEPTIGLDVVSKAAMREFLRRLNADHGTLAFDGTLDALRATVPGETSIEDVVARLYAG